MAGREELSVPVSKVLHSLHFYVLHLHLLSVASGQWDQLIKLLFLAHPKLCTE